MKPAEYHAAARKILQERKSEKTDLHVAVLSSNSLEYLEPFLIVESARKSTFLSTEFSAYGQIEQTLLQDGSSWQREPNVFVISLCIEDQVPAAFFRPRRKDGDSLLDVGRQCVKRLCDCVEIIRRSSKANILLANFSAPFEENSTRLFDANDPDGTSYTVERINRELAEAVSELPGVTIWDYAGLVRASGSRNWCDPRLAQIARQGIASTNRAAAAVHLVSTIEATTRPRSKCLVLDLDNTLWGGVAGDDGLNGIELGDDHPGIAFKRFQQAILSLADQGILLSICSKNDESVARRIFDTHPEMLVRWEDFLAPRVNWHAKSENLKEIAADLNIGLDSLVLFDDNPVEREEVRINAPSVGIIEVPSSPIDYVDTLFSSVHFDTPSLTDEDIERGNYYRDDEKRKNLGSTFESVDDFLRSLNMTAVLGNADKETINRIAHLIAKTNQFNLTTRRRSQAKLESLAGDANWDIRWIRLADRFGDNGIVGVSVVNHGEDESRIDTLLMSCRVMNRHVEDAMLADIATRAAARGASQIVGEFSPSDRNAVVEDFYLQRGFREVDRTADGSRRFEIDIAVAADIEWPDTISVSKNGSGQLPL